MPILIDDDLPTRWMLESDGIFVLDRAAARQQDLRPLALAVLIGDRDPSASGLVRLLSSSPLQLTVDLLRRSDQVGDARLWEAASGQRYDGIVFDAEDGQPGAIATSPAWDEVRDVLDWAAESAPCVLISGWAAAASVQHRSGVELSPLDVPVAGHLPTRILRRQSFLLRGIDEAWSVPVHQWHRVDPDDLDAIGMVAVAGLADGQPLVVRNQDRSQVHLFAHPGGIGAAPPGAAWRAGMALLFANWINFYLYQPASLGRGTRPALAGAA
ncbi:homoserine O-succinyltransferase [Planctomycetota bacterium]|nr:homoserine O-succinyltransferase [Planctomycetota bacterium]